MHFNLTKMCVYQKQNKNITIQKCPSSFCLHSFFARFSSSFSKCVFMCLCVFIQLFLHIKIRLLWIILVFLLLQFWNVYTMTIYADVAKNVLFLSISVSSYRWLSISWDNGNNVYGPIHNMYRYAMHAFHP